VGVVLIVSIAPKVSPLLTNVRPADPVFLAFAAAVLLLTGCVALAAPAWQVRSVQPAAVLKKD
jgi:hypothetical protein